VARKAGPTEALTDTTTTDATPVAADAVSGHCRDSVLETARRVLAIEARGLKALADGLDGPFSETVALLAGIRNRARVVVSGMGKSGHIARKVAATLASTGTPAIYVHPGEASHGDLGMIAPGDVIIALSNSGETPELADLVTYAKRFEIPLVAITGRADSELAQAATVSLVLPDVAEACPLGLAPTTSTTMMVALGDALSVALLERKGFTPEQFHTLHPGGKLGRRLLKVGDLMHTGDLVPLVRDTDGMAEALIVMTAKSFGCIGAVDAEGRLIGVVTDGDLRRHMRSDLLDQMVCDVMTVRPKTIRADAVASEALHLMNARAITSLFVVDGERPVGLLHIHDCLRAGVA
jgi:arabinose-5-phosphate isomerase